MGMESVNFRFSMDATSKIFNVRGWMDMDARSKKIYRKSIAGMSLAGMSLLACNMYSAGCFLGGVCGSLWNVRYLVESAVAC